MQMHQSGGKKAVVFRQILPYVSIIQPFRILIGRFHNVLNRARLMVKFDAWIFQMC